MPDGPVGHRERIVYETAQHLRRAGVTGTGLRQVVADAGAPRGSFQHYFPGGKDQLVGRGPRVVRLVGGRRASSGTSPACAARPPAGSSRPWSTTGPRTSRARDFERGCPVAGAVVDCADTNPAVRQAASAALETWRRPITEAVVAMGRTRRRAETLSTLMLCALEGALVLARARRDTAPCASSPASSPRSSTPDPLPPAVRCSRGPQGTRGYIERVRRGPSAVGVAGRAGVAALPAPGVPVPPVAETADALGRPHDDVRQSGRDVLLAARAQVVARGGRPAHGAHGPAPAGIRLLARGAALDPRHVERHVLARVLAGSTTRGHGPSVGVRRRCGSRAPSCGRGSRP